MAVIGQGGNWKCQSGLQRSSEKSRKRTEPISVAVVLTLY